MWTPIFDYAPTVCYIILVILCYWYMTIPKKLPPGPMGLPFIGSSLDTWNAEKQHVILTKWAQKYGPLYKIYIGARLIVVLGDWNTIHEALVKKGEIFAGRPRLCSFQPSGIPHNHGIIFSDGEVWKQHRQFASTTLRDLGLGRSILEARITEEVEYLIREINSTSGIAFDIEKMLENAVSNVMCVMQFGRRYDYKDTTYKNLLDALRLRANQSKVGFLSPFILSPWLGRLLAFTPAVQRFKKSGEQLTTLVKNETKAAASNFDPSLEPTNYIHAFLKMQIQRENACESSNFTEAQLVQIGVELFAAGTETTSNTIRWAILYLAHHPDIQRRMYDEIRDVIGYDRYASLADRGRLPYTEAVIMETQRIASLVPLSVMHRTMAATNLLGYDIPADTLVIPLLSAVLLDPKTYPEPDRFDPTRFLDDHGILKKDPKFIPFSTGKRICLGETLAKMELFLFITGVFSKFEFTFPADEPKPEIKGSIGFTHIPLAFKIRAMHRE